MPPAAGVEVQPGRAVVALVLADAAQRAEIEASLLRAGHGAVADDALGDADVIVAEVDDDVVGTVATLRRTARSDAALVLLLRLASRDAVADAHRAGAFACLRAPPSVDELLRVIGSATGHASAKVLAQPGKPHETGSATIGRISAGLSHELGNPLAALSMNLDIVATEAARLAEGEQLLRAIVEAQPSEVAAHLAAARSHLEGAPPQGEILEAIDDARGSTARMRELLATMKELVGRPSRTVVPCDLAALVHDVRKEAEQELLADVDLEEVVDGALWGLANGALLRQTLLLLLANAAAAAKSLASPRVRLHLYELGEEAVVSVRDNGPGIDLDVQEKIFEPFYTTRRGRGGVGLGLSLCREYVAQMGGRITLWSMPGRGACLRVHLHRLGGR